MKNKHAMFHWPKYTSVVAFNCISGYQQRKENLSLSRGKVDKKVEGWSWFWCRSNAVILIYIKTIKKKWIVFQLGKYTKDTLFEIRSEFHVTWVSIWMTIISNLTPKTSYYHLAPKFITTIHFPAPRHWPLISFFYCQYRETLLKLNWFRSFTSVMVRRKRPNEIIMKAQPSSTLLLHMMRRTRGMVRAEGM